MAGRSGDDVRSVRALAHPLRLQLLDLLRFEGDATATLLARRLRQSTGATSYHLRQLAHYGYIEDVSPGGGRERWWRYREKQLTIGPGTDRRGQRKLLAELLARDAHALDRFLARQSHYPKWTDVAFFHSKALSLTPTELDLLRRKIDALLDPLRRANAKDVPRSALPVRVLAFGFPTLLDS